MTAGQASLFDALFSLARPGEEYYVSPDSTSRHPLDPEESLLTPVSEKGGEAPSIFTSDDLIDDTEDPEGIKAIMVRAVPLDRNVESNSLPFILESYAIWIGRMIFEPLRVAHVGREYVFRKYSLGETARLRLMLVSHFARAVARTTDYDINNLPSLARFREHMSQSYQVASSNRNTSRGLDVRSAAVAFDHSYELISIACKLLPLSAVLAIMQAGAPIFRSACPEPPEALVHLPGLLLNIDVSLRYFATMDVLLSVITNRPMFFRYNVEFTPQVTESMMYIENHLGLQWLYGVPDRLVVTLARMNALREDFGFCVDGIYIREIEEEIASFRALGGANSEDARVKKAHKRFMQTFKDSRPGRHPDLFLVLPMVILGIATHQAEDQALIRRRMLGLPDCARRKTLGNEVVRILDHIWAQARLTGDGMYYVAVVFFATYPSLFQASTTNKPIDGICLFSYLNIAQKHRKCETLTSAMHRKPTGRLRFAPPNHSKDEDKLNMFNYARALSRTILPKARMGIMQPRATRIIIPGQIHRPFMKNSPSLQNQEEHKVQSPGNVKQGLSEENRYLDLRRDNHSTAPKVWGGGVDAVITAMTGVVVVFFGGIAYVAWYKADVLDKIEEAFAPGYDPVLELMSYPSRSGEVDEDGKWTRTKAPEHYS
ncbi:unnamed protein product [Rhizoctonia solani]|uniref:Uncharacterized protein n=1 Tax=Rhizoctonia solani TaxID=456999 RepID=A0A8H3HWI6_9AGAM|nr:unnamed protein product [Rhizoctonia solani]